MNIKKLLAITAMALAVFSACEKEDVKEPILVPTLKAPANEAILKNIPLTEDGLINNVDFSWKEKQSDVSYTLYLSDDNSNWIASGTVIEWDFNRRQRSDYPFEFGKKYYWKVTATRLDKNFEETDERVESEVFSFSTYLTPISNLKGRASSFTYWPDEYEGTKAFIDITWEDSQNVEYVQITFEPALEGVEQPIKVEAGKQLCHIEGFNGWGSVAGSPEPQVYEFTVKTYGIDDLVTEGQSFKAQPLTKSFVHDADYNTYVPIKIGDQVWLSSNLRTTHFNNGVEIGDDILINRGWSDGEHSFDEYIYSINYHSLPHTVMTNEDVCPVGFHISTYEDWQELEEYFGVAADGTHNELFGVEQKFGKILKAESGWGDKEDGSSANGTGVLNFNAVPSIYGFEATILGSDGSGEIRYHSVKYNCATTKIIVPTASLLTTVRGTVGRLKVKILLSESDGVYQVQDATGVIRCVQDTE